MKIATIEKISEIYPHPNADKMELAKINGWQVCVKKNEFKAGDLCIYITVDSVLEDCPQYEFLRNKNFRIKTIKLRGELSQGIAFPISLLKEFGHDIIPLDDPVDGTDVADLVKAKHYEKPIPANLAGQVKGYRPSYIKKTDEDNIKSNPGILVELYNLPYVITVKVDGCLHEDTIIHTEDGDMTIKDVCENKYSGRVLSYDVDNDKSLYLKIQNHFINDTNDEWYEIETESGLVLKITGNHKVWIPNLNCYRSVENLTENDSFLIK